jgi:hypothetical protein
MGQTLVGTTPENRTALLEKYGWVDCGWCPQGDVTIDELVVEHGSDVVPVAMHGGSTTDPLPGHPDFRTPWSDTLFTHYAIVGWPLGVINRVEYNGLTLLPRTAWAAAVDAVLSLPSPVNLGVSSSFDPDTREMVVDVELYYTGTSMGMEDRLQVLIKESHIIGYQNDYVNGPQPAFDHKHILRAYLTSIWGDSVTPTTPGSLVQRTFTFTLPEEWVVENCEVVAFVSEGQSEVYQARSVEVNGGITTAIDQNAVIGSASIMAYPVPASDLIRIALPDDAAGSVLSIMDATGRTVFVHRVTTAGPLELDLDPFANGAYTVLLRGTMDTRYGRFVVQR